MSLLTMIDEIDTLITNAAPIATIKPKLCTLREQTQAQEREITQLQVKYDTLEKVVTEHQNEITRLKAPQSKPNIESSGSKRFFDRKGQNGLT
jgi:chromosome segregation ATPase